MCLMFWRLRNRLALTIFFPPPLQSIPRAALPSAQRHFTFQKTDQLVTHRLKPYCCMCKCVLVLKMTKKNLYIVVVMLLCVKIKKKDFRKKQLFHWQRAIIAIFQCCSWCNTPPKQTKWKPPTN